MVLFRKIGIIFTALLLVAATGGYSVFRHYCECEGRVIASVFLEAVCDHDNTPAEFSCCALTDHSRFCCNEEAESQSGGHCHSGNCCHTSTQFLKISDSYQVAKILSVQEISAPASPAIQHEILPEEIHEIALGHAFDDPSPPPAGRQLLITLHQFKLAPELG